jgi:NADH-ubiquinone oxidoreductase chain 1
MLVMILPVLLSVAFITIAERKTMASMQRRLGPNIVGYYGVLQPFADALKLLIKEYITPTQSNIILFFLGPIITLAYSLYGYAVIPFGPGISITDFNLGLLYTLAVSSLATYGILLAGWSANSKYAFLGSLRSTAQLISYELILSSVILVLVFLSGTFNLSIIIEVQKAVYFILLAFPLFMIFYVAGVAETNRAPFDLAEAESELVSGFMTEHAAGIFVFFFLAEYASIILICILISIIFLGGYEILGFIYNIQELILNIVYYIYLCSIYVFNIFLSILNFMGINNINLNNISYDDFINLFSLNSNYIINNNVLSILNPSALSIKSLTLVFLFILVRASYPRLRFDKLMSYCWTELLPIVIGIIIFIPCISFIFNILLYNVSLI